MKNYNQIRAAHALSVANEDYTGKNNGKSSGVVKKIPDRIRNHGLLGAIAFAIDENQGSKRVFTEAIIPYLTKKCERMNLGDINSCEDLLKKLTDEKTDSVKLRYITQEVLNYLDFLRRFVKDQDTDTKEIVHD